MDPKEQEEADKVNLVHSLKKRVRIEYSRICRQRRQKKAELAKVSFFKYFNIFFSGFFFLQKLNFISSVSD